MKIKTLGWLISPCIALAACTETALDYRSAEGTVVIAPEWGAFACPATACYRFYADNGEAVAGYGTDAAASVGYFSTTLPVGSYHLLAYNTDAHGVAFTGLESRNAAEVRLVSEMQPGNVYSWNVDDVDVPLQGTVHARSAPSGETDVASFSGNGHGRGKSIEREAERCLSFRLAAFRRAFGAEHIRRSRNEYVVYRDADTGGNQKYGTRLYGFGRDTPAGAAFS